MYDVLRFAHPYVLYGLLVVCFIALLVRLKWHTKTFYMYPLTSHLIKNKVAIKHPYKIIFFIIRTIVLFLLAFLIGKPQLVDKHSKVHVEGLDMMLSIDVSGSMQYVDDKEDQRYRVYIAKA